MCIGEDHFRKLEAALSSFSYIDDMDEGDAVYSMCWNHVSTHKVQANKAAVSMVETANVKEVRFMVSNSFYKFIKVV